MFAQFKRNVKFARVAKTVLRDISSLTAENTEIFPDLWEKKVDMFGARQALRSEFGNHTYAELDALSNRFAHWALTQGYNHESCVAIVMENRPELIAAWFGLSKVGVKAALVNPQLSGQSLVHCIDTSNAVAIVCDASLDAVLVQARPSLSDNTAIWSWDGIVGQSLKHAITACPDTRPARIHRQDLRAKDVCLYMFTSGTTGMPKAAKMTHLRVMLGMKVFVAQIASTPNDVMYNTLPLYHATGGLCALGISLMTGGTHVIRRKFSARNFWKDVVTEEATLFAYIGEICRYLVKAPECINEVQHNLRAGFGNGLAADVWGRFVDRFDVPQMLEMYASTEGNVNMSNFDGKIGAMGRLPLWSPPKLRNSVKIIKVDEETGDPILNKHGHCIVVKANETGEAIGLIGTDVRQRFEGYNDPEANKKKILNNAFKQGDAWFRTGDLMRQDRAGYFYFIDRTGDTLRWKGENVATTEVGNVIAQYPGVETANVYGVKVPGEEGRVGMASITLSAQIDWDGLRLHLQNNLPKHAIPRFIRQQKSANLTGTFKLAKVELVNQGFDPEKITDPLMYFDPANDHFEPITAQLHEKLVNGGVR